MMNHPEAKINLRVPGRRRNWGLVTFLAGFCLLFALAGYSYAGPVKEVNASSPGETLDLKTLPVRGKTTLVDVYSPYCPPCMRLAPMLAKLARKRHDLAVRKVNIQRSGVTGGIDWQSPLAQQLKLHSIPHFMIFDPQGKLVAEGREARPQVIQWLQEAGVVPQN